MQKVSPPFGRNTGADFRKLKKNAKKKRKSSVNKSGNYTKPWQKIFNRILAEYLYGTKNINKSKLLAKDIKKLAEDINNEKEL